jgi:hypothetical protein
MIMANRDGEVQIENASRKGGYPYVPVMLALISLATLIVLFLTKVGGYPALIGVVLSVIGLLYFVFKMTARWFPDDPILDENVEPESEHDKDSSQDPQHHQAGKYIILKEGDKMRRR